MAIIGIDLGTSNSLIACFKDGKPFLIENEYGEYLTPSVVGIDDKGEILVGKAAKERLLTHPKRTFSVFKRFMGTEKIYRFKEKKFTPVHFSALVLKSLKSDAERFLNEKVEKAVISVPAYFNNKQRQATIDAAKIAGIEVTRVISEPTAASLAYGITKNKSDETIMVLDLGGGTFDVSILEYFEGVMQVVAIKGDNYLGGENFTEVIVDDFLKEHGIERDSLTTMEIAKIKRKAEVCKISLTEENSVKTGVILKDIEYEYEISNAKYKKLANILFERIKKPIVNALNDSKWSVKDIDYVILIGGATKMPIVRDYIKSILKKFPYTNINPDQAVALGAAIQGALKEKSELVEEMVLVDVCPYTLGIGSFMERKFESKEVFSPIIERNTTIPVSIEKKYKTILDGQKIVKIAVYQGESINLLNNLKLGEFEVYPPKGSLKGTDVFVRFTYDKNGILEVLTNFEGLEPTRVIIKNTPGSLSEKEVLKILNELEDIKIHPKDVSVNKYVLNRAYRLYEESLGEDRILIASIIGRFELALNNQNLEEIEKERGIIKTVLDEIESYNDFFD